MKTPAPFDPLLRFAEIERLVAKISAAFASFSHPPGTAGFLVGHGS